MSLLNISEKLRFPYLIKTVDPILNEQLLKDFTGERTCFLQVGPKNYFLRSTYAEESEEMYNFNVRSDDVFVVTYPRSGTTMTQELVWLLCNDLDYSKAAQVPLTSRFPFYELSSLIHKEVKAELLAASKEDPKKCQMMENMFDPKWKALALTEGRRFIKSHLPLSLLPPDLSKGTCKVIYVARNPLDVIVSFFHLLSSLRIQSYQGNFRTFWNYFKNDSVVYAPYWEHVKEAWEKRNQENFLFIFYENITRNMDEELKKIMSFLGKSYTDQQLEQLKEHMQIENFKKNRSVNTGLKHEELGLIVENKRNQFIRNGKVGGYKEYFDEEMEKEAQQWISHNLKDTDLKFPVQL